MAIFSFSNPLKAIFKEFWNKNCHFWWILEIMFQLRFPCVQCIVRWRNKFVKYWAGHKVYKKVFGVIIRRLKRFWCAQTSMGSRFSCFCRMFFKNRMFGIKQCFQANVMFCLEVRKKIVLFLQILLMAFKNLFGTYGIPIIKQCDHTMRESTSMPPNVRRWRSFFSFVFRVSWSHFQGVWE